MHDLLNQLVGLIGEKTPWQGSCCGAHDVHITRVLEWVDGELNHPPQRDAYFLELIPFFSMRKSGVKCASQNMREIKSSWCKPKGSNHNDADILVARTTVRYQLERLGCTISSCAHVKNLLQNSNVEALMINWQQAPPWALADLVDSFPDEKETFSNAFDMIEANLTSLEFGECKWYIDSGAKKNYNSIFFNQSSIHDTYKRNKGRYIVASTKYSKKFKYCKAQIQLWFL